VPLGELTFDLEGGNFLDSEGQRAGMILLLGMLLSFGFIRFSTRMIRREVSWWPGNIEVGSGLHIHHLVFGILLMMVAGFVGFAVLPGSPWLEVLAASFGVGMGLTLDEFALWLYLEDVYWAEEGRRSVDAVIFAAIIGGAFLLGFAPIADSGSDLVVALGIVINLGASVVSALKGKYVSAVVGMPLPPVGYVAAIRLAKPGSRWAKRRYKRGSNKLRKARERKKRHDRRVRRFQDLVGGAPSMPSPRKKKGASRR
jgi:lysyl-tRNA synthetase class 2